MLTERADRAGAVVRTAQVGGAVVAVEHVRVGGAAGIRVDQGVRRQRRADEAPCTLPRDRVRWRNRARPAAARHADATGPWKPRSTARTVPPSRTGHFTIGWERRGERGLGLATDRHVPVVASAMMQLPAGVRSPDATASWPPSAQPALPAHTRRPPRDPRVVPDPHRAGPPPATAVRGTRTRRVCRARSVASTRSLAMRVASVSSQPRRRDRAHGLGHGVGGISCTPSHSSQARRRIGLGLPPIAPAPCRTC